MNKLLVITVLVALLALSAESFRVPRQAAAEEEEGTLTKITDTIKSYYDQSVNTASDYLESIKGMKLEEKAKNLYDETTKAVSTYAGIMQDQLYHIFYSQN
ncbi:apolipoprotein C-II [Centroberyx affinis]|uniref:apolipoprotein C-II-like n=1 Tax=Centroberyx affinis TaxID=166261 RepID=UPI003A5C1B05